MPDHRCRGDASLFLGDVSLFWYADDIFDLTVQDMAEVGNGVNVEIAALPQFGQRSGIDVELVDELVLCDPFLFQKLPERRVVHIVAFIRILHDFIIWRNIFHYSTLFENRLKCDIYRVFCNSAFRLNYIFFRS